MTPNPPHRSARSWQPSKFVFGVDGWKPSSDTKEVARGSRFVAHRLSAAYNSVVSEHARGSLLDLGCGKAPLYGMYASLVDHVVWADWPQSVHTFQRVDLAVDLNMGLPFKGGVFDTILLTDVLEHIAEPDHLWEELGRVLRHEGRIIVGVPFLYWVHEAPHDYYRYTEHALRRYCDRHGLEVVSLEPYGGAPEVMLDMVSKHVASSAVISLAILRLGLWLMGSSFVRRLSRSRSKVFPLGYVLVAEKGG